MQERAFANEKLHFAWNSAVEDVLGDEKVSGLVLRDTTTGAARDLPITGLFVAIGHDPRSELVKDQVRLDDEGYVLVEDRSTASPQNNGANTWVQPRSSPTPRSPTTC